MPESSPDIRKVIGLIRSQAPPHHFEFSDPFRVLITTMLSHRTKDEVTDYAARELFEKYKTPKDLAYADVKEIEALIRKVGFYTVKAKRIKQVAGIIVNMPGSKVPNTIEELTSLPGVGRKTANVVLADSFGIPAIAVDTHVQRISRRIGWSNSDNPEETESKLRKLIPEELWLGLNPALVEFGKKICRPIGPKCDLCRVNMYCRYYRSLTKKKSKEDAVLSKAETKKKYIL